MINKSVFIALLLVACLFSSSLIAVQAYTVDSIAKPSVPTFTVQLVNHPYDVPPKTTTTIDQYTGRETTVTQPGYRVENKSIEVTIKNQPFTSYNYTAHTYYGHETGETFNYDRDVTVNFYYNIEVKGHYGAEWKSVGGSFSSFYDGPQSNAQLDKEYTVISIKAEDYPNDAVLDFRAKALIGYYIAWGHSVVIMGYDFYGQESNWSNVQTLELNPQAPTITPAPTAFPTEVTNPSPAPTEKPTPTAKPTQPGTEIETVLGLNWEQIAIIGLAAALVVMAAVLVLSRRKRT